MRRQFLFLLAGVRAAAGTRVADAARHLQGRIVYHADRVGDADLELSELQANRRRHSARSPTPKRDACPANETAARSKQTKEAPVKKLSVVIALAASLAFAGVASAARRPAGHVRGEGHLVESDVQLQLHAVRLQLRHARDVHRHTALHQVLRRRCAGEGDPPRPLRGARSTDRTTAHGRPRTREPGRSRSTSQRTPRTPTPVSSATAIPPAAAWIDVERRPNGADGDAADRHHFGHGAARDGVAGGGLRVRFAPDYDLGDLDLLDKLSCQAPRALEASERRIRRPGGRRVASTSPAARGGDIRVINADRTKRRPEGRR